MELVINFSGGKDSSAMLAYLRENYSHVKTHVVMADTGWEHPDAVEWSRGIVESFGLELHVVRAYWGSKFPELKGKPKTFLGMVEKRGKFPASEQRQCTSDLKRGPIGSWIVRNVKDPLVVSAMGLRAEESRGASPAGSASSIRRRTYARSGNMTPRPSTSSAPWSSGRGSP